VCYGRRTHLICTRDRQTSDYGGQHQTSEVIRRVISCCTGQRCRLQFAIPPVHKQKLMNSDAVVCPAKSYCSFIIMSRLPFVTCTQNCFTDDLGYFCRSLNRAFGTMCPFFCRLSVCIVTHILWLNRTS